MRRIIPHLSIGNRVNTRFNVYFHRCKLDWTIVRCTTIKEKPASGKITASLDSSRNVGIDYTV